MCGLLVFWQFDRQVASVSAETINVKEHEHVTGIDFSNNFVTASQPAMTLVDLIILGR